MAAESDSSRIFRCPHCDALFQVLSRGGIVRFKRPATSSAVIKKLVELEYLKPSARHSAGAIEKAIARVRNDLIRAGVVLRR